MFNMTNRLAAPTQLLACIPEQGLVAFYLPFIEICFKQAASLTAASDMRRTAPE